MTTTKYTTLRLGHDGAWYKKELEKKGTTISIYASDMLDATEASPETDVDIAIMSLKEMGFTEEWTKWSDIIKRVKELGDVCPAEVGPALALNGVEGLCTVSMEPIADRGGGPRVFDVGRRGDGSLGLDGGWAHPDRTWSLGGRIVFRLRKS